MESPYLVIVYILIGFVIGVFTGFYANEMFRKWAYAHKLYGIDSKQTLETFLVVTIAFVWFVATFLAVFTREPVDPALHGIFGTVVGGYFGVKFLGKSK